jgi:hypothetical protein
LKKSEVLDILSEVACLRKLNHQHIVHLKEAWLDGSRVLLIEELLEVDLCVCFYVEFLSKTPSPLSFHATSIDHHTSIYTYTNEKKT